MISDWIATGEKPYPSVWQCMLFEEITKLDTGTLITTIDGSIGKIPFDQTTNLKQWKSLVIVIDTIAIASNFF